MSEARTNELVARTTFWVAATALCHAIAVKLDIVDEFTGAIKVQSAVLRADTDPEDR